MGRSSMFFPTARWRDRQDGDRRRGRVASEGKALHRPRPTARPWLPATARADEATAADQGPGRAVRDLRAGIGTAALAFRGYDQTNLGRSPELLAHPAYGPIVRDVLDEASRVASGAVGRPIDLVARIESRAATTLESFAEDVATIV